MGLKSGPGGFKALMREQAADAFRTYASLEAVRDAVLASETTTTSRREKTAVFVDGNVLMMAIPAALATFEAYTAQVYRYVAAARRAGAIVVVVFDEPEHLTHAKREEQIRRDGARAKRQIVACSEDLRPVVPSDFTVADLMALPSVHVVKDDRRLRSRFFDAVARAVYEKIAATSSPDHGFVVFDGVDLRACDRAAAEARAPFITATNPLGDVFERSEPIGEGDIKLAWLDNRLRTLVRNDARFAHVRLALTCTIDTDSLATGLIDTARQRCGNTTTTPPTQQVHSVLCMREAAWARSRRSDCDDGVAQTAAAYLCCDLSLLEECVQKHVWKLVLVPGAPCPPPPPEAQLGAVLFICAVAAGCGCDFTGSGFPGARFDHFWEAIPEHVATDADAVAPFGHLLTSTDVHGSALDAVSALRRACHATAAHMSTKPRYKRQAMQVHAPPLGLLLRTVWSLAYWAQIEHPADVAWGFTGGRARTEKDAEEESERSCLAPMLTT